MKQFLFLFFIAFISSCTHIQTKFVFHEDGSGYYANTLILDIPKESAKSTNTQTSTTKKTPLKAEIIQLDDRTKLAVHQTKDEKLVYGLSYRFDSMDQLLDSLNEIGEALIENEGNLAKEKEQKERKELRKSLNQLSNSATINEYVEYSNIKFSGNQLSVSSYNLSEISRKEINEFLEVEFFTPGFSKMKYQFLYRVPGKIKHIQCSGNYRKINDSTVLLEFSLAELGRMRKTPSLIIKW